MNILVVKENHGQHGVNISADRLTNYLTSIGHEVKEITILNKPQDGEPDERDLSQWTIEKVRETLVPRTISKFNELLVYDYDLILSNDILSTVVVNEVKSKVHSHAFPEVVNFMHNEPYKILRLYNLLMEDEALPRAMKKAIVNIVLSEPTKLQFEELFPDTKFEVFDNIVDVESNWKKSLTRAKEKQFEEIHLVMISAGARVREKGIDEIPLIAERLEAEVQRFYGNGSQRYKKFVFDLIGFDESEVDFSSKDSNSIVEFKFHGRLSNEKAMEVIKDAHFLLSLSLFETLLVTAIEAAQLGVTIVGYDTNDINKEYFHCKVPYGRRSELAKSILGLSLKRELYIEKVANQLKYVESFKPAIAGRKFMSIVEKYKNKEV